MRQICKRMFVVSGSYVIVPELQDCDRELQAATSRGRAIALYVVAGGDLSFAFRPEGFAVPLYDIRFIRFRLEASDGRLQADTGEVTSNAQIVFTIDPKNIESGRWTPWIMSVSIGKEAWKGTVDLSKAPFDPGKRIGDQLDLALKATGSQ